MRTAAVQDVFGEALQALAPPLNHPRLREAATFLESGRSGAAAKLLHEFLHARPGDTGALRLLAEVARQKRQMGRAEELLQKVLDCKPAFAAARFDYANLLLEKKSWKETLLQADILLKREPRNPLFRKLRAEALTISGDHRAAMLLWQEMVVDYPASPQCWVRYGSALRSVAAGEDSIAAFRRAVAIDPTSSGGWLSLADMKTFRFTPEDLTQMEASLARAEISADDRSNLHFALGKAYGDARLFETSYHHFAKGNALRRVEIQYDPEVLTAYVSACKSVFTSDFFRRHAGAGCVRSDPVFLVGMPRAGSTLVEQILASHSQIEGTEELADLSIISREIQQRAKTEGHNYPQILPTMDPAGLRRYGESYLERTQVHRQSARPFFTDKMGANFALAGLIHLILPNAKIIDVRRHPMACCFSNYSQVFAQGTNNAYRLSDLARLYCDYVELMDHFDAVMPGRVHRVFYEELVQHPEREARRLLDYIGVTFEDSCLNFFDTARTITTVSSEQVRRPIYHDALDYWRNYEPWLGPLRTALGPVVDTYPQVPVFS
ncbi:MAG TPA: sulfotransferase [Rhizomicrobium sp.]|nr:sulfotransferase [Rhizomicrobium sp.]